MPRKSFDVYDFVPRTFLRRRLTRSKKNQVLDSIISHLKSLPRHCQTVVEESDYIDKDYQDEFAAFYSKAFRNYSARCTRYHFFSAHLSKRDLHSIDRFKDAYLGFMVLRPTSQQQIGRTALSQPSTTIDHRYTHCLAQFSAHIFGHELVVAAMPFAQQETQVGACAHVSLWMVARYMSSRFGDRQFFPSQINALAKAKTSWGRTFPADRGLDQLQILDALQGMGYPAEIYTPDNIVKFPEHIEDIIKRPLPKTRRRKLISTITMADIAYRYIESRLPVIFLTDHHAFVGIGHTLITPRKIGASIQRISSFISHNDAVGPYQEVPLWKQKRGTTSFNKIEGVITLIPPEATLRGEDAESKAWEVIEQLFHKGWKGIRLLFSERRDLARWWRDKLLLRTYLIRSVDWQSDLIRQRERKHLDPDVCRRLIELDYPKYIWVTEVTSNALQHDKKAGDRTCLGCVVQDSTAPPLGLTTLAAFFWDALTVFDIANAHSPLRQRTTPFRNSTPFLPRRMAEFQVTSIQGADKNL